MYLVIFFPFNLQRSRVISRKLYYCHVSSFSNIDDVKLKWLYDPSYPLYNLATYPIIDWTSTILNTSGWTDCISSICGSLSTLTNEGLYIRFAIFGRMKTQFF